ncbi:MAG TPA: hypothetical protein VGF51_12245 [Acidimicrobiales bacterium]
MTREQYRIEGVPIEGPDGSAWTLEGPNGSVWTMCVGSVKGETMTAALRDEQGAMWSWDDALAAGVRPSPPGITQEETP